MAAMTENERMEYSVLMSRGRDAERTCHFCWIASGIAATMLLSWAIAARNAGLMLPVIFAVAYGFYTMVHGRSQTRLIGGYVKEFFEGNDSSNSGPLWFTRLGRLEMVPGFSASNADWLMTAMANVVIVTSVIFAWVFASAMPKGELYAGIATGCAMAFLVHSISETTRMRQSDAAAFWRQVGMGAVEERSSRPQQRFAAR